MNMWLVSYKKGDMEEAGDLHSWNSLTGTVYNVERTSLVEDKNGWREMSQRRRKVKEERGGDWNSCKSGNTIVRFSYYVEKIWLVKYRDELMNGNDSEQEKEEDDRGVQGLKFIKQRQRNNKFFLKYWENMVGKV